MPRADFFTLDGCASAMPADFAPADDLAGAGALECAPPCLADVVVLRLLDVALFLELSEDVAVLPSTRRRCELPTTTWSTKSALELMTLLRRGLGHRRNGFPLAIRASITPRLSKRSTPFLRP